MNILIVPDVPHWAIGKLSKAIMRHNSDMNIKIVCVHPRDAEEQESIDKIKAELGWADVIHFQYWNTAQKLIKKIPELRDKKTILTHHNQKNLTSEDWNLLGIDVNICHTQKAASVLRQHGAKNVQIIQHGIDLRYYEYCPKLPEDDKCYGYVGRICPWKGLKEIAKASREIGFPVKIMGKIDKPEYWNDISEFDKNNMQMEFMDCKDSEKVQYFYSINCYVGNSNDGREEGTLGLLEAMACGIPVVTTPSGEAADICEHEKNALVVPFGDYDALKAAMKRIMFEEGLADKLRANAWNTVKNMSDKKMALEYRRAYKKLYYGDKPLVSVIVPYTKEREVYAKQIEVAYQQQSYPAVEVLLMEDKEPGYNLAKIRNMGAIHADSEILIFNDSRMLPDKNVVEGFISYFLQKDGSICKDKQWIFGEKGGNKANFVENFSAITRENFIKGGMCNERINRYGAMSQELRERFKFNGFSFLYAPEVKCSQLCGTHKTRDRRQDIIESKLQMFRMGL